jgi:hypothetical protein
MSFWLDELHKCTKVLSSSASEQIAHLHKGEATVHVDELALEFDDAFANVATLLDGNEVDAQQAASLGELGAMLASMSGKPNAALWTHDALRRRGEWAQVRTLAARCHRELQSAE